MTESIIPEPIQEPVSVDDNLANLSVDWIGSTAPTVGQKAMASSLPVVIASDQSAVTIAEPVTVDQATASNLNAQVVGAAAHDAANAGNPVLSAATHETIADTAPTNRLATITDGDVTRLSATDGAAFVITSGPQQWKARIVNNVTADTTVKAAPAAGLSLYVTDVIFSIGAATASSVLLEESTTTPVFGPHYLEAVNGRGVAVHFTTPIKIAAATLLSCTNTGATTNTLDVYGFTAPG